MSPGFLGVGAEELVDIEPEEEAPAFSAGKFFLGAEDNKVVTWDGAETWSYVVVDIFDPVDIPGGYFGLVRNVAAAEDGTIYAVEEGGGKLAKSTDEGATWSLVTGYTVSVAGIQSIAVDAENRLYVCNLDGVERSTDGGSSWAAFGDISPSNDALGGVQFTDTGKVWIGMGDGIVQVAQRFDADGTNRDTAEVPDFDHFDDNYPATEGGSEDKAWLFASWQSTRLIKAELPNADYVTPDTGTWHCHGIAALGAGIVVGLFSPYPDGGAGISAGTIYRSTDDGDTWASVASGVEYRPDGFAIPPLVARDRDSGTIIYLASEVALYRSTDSGATFTAVPGTIPASRLVSLSVPSKITGTCFVAQTTLHWGHDTIEDFTHWAGILETFNGEGVWEWQDNSDFDLETNWMAGHWVSGPTGEPVPSDPPWLDDPEGYLDGLPRTANPYGVNGTVYTGPCP